MSRLIPSCLMLGFILSCSKTTDGKLAEDSSKTDSSRKVLFICANSATSNTESTGPKAGEDFVEQTCKNAYDDLLRCGYSKTDVLLWRMSQNNLMQLNDMMKSVKGKKPLVIMTMHGAVDNYKENELNWNANSKPVMDQSEHQIAAGKYLFYTSDVLNLVYNTIPDATVFLNSCGAGAVLDEIMKGDKTFASANLCAMAPKFVFGTAIPAGENWDGSTASQARTWSVLKPLLCEEAAFKKYSGNSSVINQKQINQAFLDDYMNKKDMMGVFPSGENLHQYLLTHMDTEEELRQLSAIVKSEEAKARGVCASGFKASNSRMKTRFALIAECPYASEGSADVSGNTTVNAKSSKLVDDSLVPAGGRIVLYDDLEVEPNLDEAAEQKDPEFKLVIPNFDEGRDTQNFARFRQYAKNKCTFSARPYQRLMLNVSCQKWSGAIPGTEFPVCGSGFELSR